jgi:uncharacterized repeat protein (TIGR03803 family)
MTCTPETISPSQAHSAVKHDSEKRGLCQLLCGVLLFLATSALASPAQTFTSLASFNGTDGAYPYYVYLVQGTDGNFYGTASSAGANNEGTFFKVTTAGKLTPLYNFCSLTSCADGSEPAAGLVLASNGAFYGTTVYGGANGQGAVYKITPAGKLSTLHSFNGTDGAYPYVGLIQAANGNLYGTTSGGGTDNLGTIFEITPGGKLSSLHSFSGADGQYPDGRLVQGTNGNFYGMTYEGGANSGGTVFQITTGGKLTTLYSFTGGADGAGPVGALIQASNGKFYGTTSAGGAHSGGTVFEMAPGGTASTLYSFCKLSSCADGETPWAGLIQATDGNLYGTTSAGGANGGGTIFRITTAGTLTTLYSFCSQSGCTDGDSPYEGLLQATNGDLYGTTYYGGTDNDGTIYSSSVGLGPFVQTVTTSGKVGAAVIILGNNLTGTTNVSFNGTTATFTVASGTEIKTTVPAGATTGTVEVTTPKGTLKSNVIFRVTPQITNFTPPSGKVGTPVTINGVSLTQTKNVTFGGVIATTFNVNSDIQVTANVPTGAKTGHIAITTLGGTVVSSGIFTVTQ